MKNRIFLIALTVGMFTIGWFSPQPVLALSTTNSIGQIGISASLFNNENKVINNGSYDIRFAIYATDRTTSDPYPSNRDARIWEETQKVDVKSGLIKAFLGSVVPFPATLNFQTGDYYIGIRIGTDSEMVPRKKLSSVPSAINTQYFQGKTIGINKGDIPVIASTGTLDIAILNKINQVGTIKKGAWQGTAIADSYIANALTGKTYNGINLITTTGNHTLTLSTDVTLDQNLSMTSDVVFNTLSLVDALSPQNGGTGQTSYTDGQLLIGNTTGNTLTKATLTGTTNQVIVTNGSGSITLSLPQSIATTSTPTFGSTTINGSVSILEGGMSPSFHTIFQGGNQSADVTYTLPVALGGAGEVLKTDASGNLYWAIGIGTVTSVGSGNGLTGGPVTTSGTLSINLLTSVDGTGSTSSNSGLEFQGTGNDQLALIQGCASNEVLAWDETNSLWQCASVSGVGGVTGSGTSNSVAYFTGTSSLSSEAQLSPIRGGTGINTSALTGVPSIAGGAWTVTSLLGVALGGTGVGTFTANGILYGNTTGAIQVTAAGTDAQFLVSNAGVPTFVSMSSDVTISNAGVATISANSVALTTDTTGNYVATITAGNGISGSSSTEGGTPTIALGALTADWNQTGAYDISLDNASSELKIMESSGATYYGIFDVADLSADRTYTFPDVTGTVCTTGSVCSGYQATISNPVTGTGNTDEIAYWSGTNTLGTLAVATYPSLTELSYVKGLSSAIQTQLNAKGTGNGDMLLGTVQTVTAEKIFTNSKLTILGSSTGKNIFTMGNSSASDYTTTIPAVTGTVALGTGTTDEIAYWSGTNTLGTLAVATYPSLTELSYVKGLSSAIQTQLNAKGAGTVTSVATGSGLTGGTITSSGTLSINLLTSVDGTGSTSSNSGLEFQGTGNDQLALIQGCASNEVLAWDETNSLWQCASVSGVGGVTGTGTINEIAYFTGASAVGSLAVATYPSLTELSYVKGLTSAIQTQLNSKQATLTNSAGLSIAIGGDVAVVDGGTGTSTGSITGTTALAFTAGGSDQNVTLTPSGTGYTILNGNVGIGTTSPLALLNIYGSTNAMRLSYNATNYSTLSANSTGELQIKGASVYDASLTIGSNDANSTAIIFDNSTNDFYVGIDNEDSSKFKIGLLEQDAFLTIVPTNGNVGIGITNPTYKFMVDWNGDGTNSAYVNNSNAWTNGSADYAEYFYTKDTNLTAGEAVCVDTTRANAVKRCLNSGDNNVIGIVSTAPSVLGNAPEGRENDKNYVITAMLGQIPGKVSSENGAIQIGDNLTAAATPGYMRKANAGESTVGIALQNFSDASGSIQILISRRNQSLTVEKVEQAVTDNITAMNIGDQVNALVSNAKTALDTQIANQSTVLTLQAQSIINLQNDIALLRSDGATEKSTFTLLQSQMDLIRTQNQSVIDFMLTLNMNTLVYKDVLGNLDIGTGKFTAKDIEALGTVKAKDIITDTLTMKENSTSGKGIILAGQTEVTIDTPDVTSNAKISITGKGTSNGKILYFDEIVDGKSFKVKIDDPAVEKDINFIWLIIQ